MAPLLNIEYSDYEDYENANLSLWIHEGDLFRPSTNLKLLQVLSPGIYSIDYDRELGFFCKKLPHVSDELFTFSNSKSEDLINEINLFWDKKKVYQENKLVHKRGILLTGYPGTGKTSIISQVADGVVRNEGIVFKINDVMNLQHYVNFLTLSFRKIQPETPVVTVLEDIDKYAEIESSLLDFLDGKFSIEHHIIISTSNNTDSIPDSFLRPSRMDLLIEIDLPSEKIREEFFKFKNVPDEDLPKLIKESNNCSMADLKELYICIYVLNYTIDDALDKVLSPRERKNYLFKSNSFKKIGFLE